MDLLPLLLSLGVLLPFLSLSQRVILVHLRLLTSWDQLHF